MDSVPKYQQLSQTLERQIAAGQWTEGRAPTVRGIAEEHDVSIVTAARALQVLRDKGLIRTVERSGNFIVAPSQRLGERWLLCLRITPGPLREQTAAVTTTGFEKTARRHGVVFDTTTIAGDGSLGDEELRTRLAEARVRGLCGLFLLPWRLDEAGARFDERLLCACKAAALPVVLIERNLRGAGRALEYDLVASDDLAGGRECTRHLLDQGRRRIIFITGSPVSSHDDRVAGYLREMHRDGLPATVIEQPADLTPQAAYTRLAEQVRASGADAVICYQDYTAVGLMMELLRLGIAVPDAVALVGFDDLPLGSMFTPGVTTYRLPAEEMAEEALRRMRERLRDPALPPCRLVVPGKLIVRGSSSCSAPAGEQAE